MSRTKTGITRHKRHKKVLKLTKGFTGTNRRLYKRAKEALLHAGQYAFVGRKNRKRDFRKLWIIRINAAIRAIDENLSYSKFIKALADKKIMLNRKMLAELAVNDNKAFKAVVETTIK